MRFQISLEMTSSQSFKSESVMPSKIRGVSILIGAGFGAVILSAFRNTSCTTSEEDISGFGCCGTTAGIQISDWSGSRSNSSEPDTRIVKDLVRPIHGTPKSRR